MNLFIKSERGLCSERESGRHSVLGGRHLSHGLPPSAPLSLRNLCSLPRPQAVQGLEFQSHETSHLSMRGKNTTSVYYNNGSGSSGAKVEMPGSAKSAGSIFGKMGLLIFSRSIGGNSTVSSFLHRAHITTHIKIKASTNTTVSNIQLNSNTDL